MSKEEIKSLNPLVFPLAITGIMAILYMFAFHNMRNKNEELTKQNTELQLIIDNDTTSCK